MKVKPPLYIKYEIGEELNAAKALCKMARKDPAISKSEIEHIAVETVLQALDTSSRLPRDENFERRLSGAITALAALSKKRSKNIFEIFNTKRFKKSET